MRDPNRPTVLDRVMENPLVGLAPWIVYSIVEGPNRLELSAAIALGIAAVVLCVNWIRGQSPKMLEWADVAYFAALAIVVAFAGADLRTWLEKYGGEVANIVLMVIVVGSIVIRRPFTLPYAKESTPEDVWVTPEFIRVNYLISWVWAAAFTIEAASGLFGDVVLDQPNNFWTSWVIETFPMIVAAQFTIWYPDRLEKLRNGAEPPSVRAFLATLTPWLTVLGILVLSIGGVGPEWFGIALIVGGVVATRALARSAKPVAARPGAA